MKIFEGEVKFYNQYGEGVVFFKSKPIYIYGAILNEIIEYTIEKEFDTYGKGKLIKVLKRSNNRIDHNIKDASLIGGYDLIHMNEKEQKNFKVNQVKNCFKKNSNTELHDLIWFCGSKKIKYRNKITLHDGCFYKKNSNEKIEVDDFLLSDIEWNKNLKGNVVYRKLDTLIFGNENENNKYTFDTMLGFKFRIGLNSFYQVNKEVAEYAYSRIIDNIIPNSKSLDLYCGIGVIGILLSNKSKKVIGVEINKHSFEDALFNKELNKISNIEFFNNNVDEFVKSNKENFENVILDPARFGVDKKTLKLIVDKIKPKRIIYMSCNPSTQAADFNHLKEKYKIDKFYVMDMFPQTYHIETLMILTKID